jgi:hypothetical protein
LTPSDTFRGFIAAINGHDVPALVALMTPGHVFVDSLGSRVSGSATMEKGWRGYFAMCPDYRIRIDHVAAIDSIVLAAGEVDGTIDGTPWHTPAAWRSVIRDGLVAEFQVFADNKPVYDIFAKRNQR